jgi:hypothetical protein
VHSIRDKPKQWVVTMKTKVTTIGHVTIEGDIGLTSSRYMVVVSSAENSDP